MEEQTTERRSFPRVPVKARVRVSHSLIGTIEGKSINISDTGLYVNLENVPKVPRGAHVGLQMLDSVNPGIIFNTRVIHVTDIGLGIAIVDYEFEGVRYTLDELRRQWHITRTDFKSGSGPGHQQGH